MNLLAEERTDKAGQGTLLILNDDLSRTFCAVIEERSRGTNSVPTSSTGKSASLRLSPTGRPNKQSFARSISVNYASLFDVNIVRTCRQLYPLRQTRFPTYILPVENEARRISPVVSLLDLS